MAAKKLRCNAEIFHKIRIQKEGKPNLKTTMERVKMMREREDI